MMSSARASAGLLALGSLLVACAAPAPIRYFTLQSVTPVNSPGIGPAEIPAGAGAGAGGPVILEPVRIPAELDRLELVTHIGAYKVRVDDNIRWVAPLDDQIRHVLWEDLASRLAPGSMALPEIAQSGLEYRSLSVTIVTFALESDCSTTLRAGWVLRGKGRPPITGSARFERPPEGPCTVNAGPASMSAALGALADNLARVIVGKGI